MEHELIRWLRKTFRPSHAITVGIGDDAAVLQPHSDHLVVTTDSICDGVHFDSAKHTPEQLGHKALAVNLSDLSAMGAQPTAAVVSLVLPHSVNLDYIKSMYYGMSRLAERFGIAICGGDTCVWDGVLSISITAIGHARQPWSLSNAKAGQTIVVTGDLGGSILGKHLNFEPRCEFAQTWAESGVVQAATDISDSLTLDLSKVASASGLGFHLVADKIPISTDAIRLAAHADDCMTPLEHALYDGEDFELLLAVESADLPRLFELETRTKLTVIGEFTESLDYLISDEQGTRTISPRGYEHQFGD